MPKSFQNNPSLSQEARQELIDYERGQALLSITSLPGYSKGVLAVLREYEAECADKVLRYKHSNPSDLFQLSCEFHGVQNAISVLEARVQRLTELAESPSPTVQKYNAF